MKPPVAAAPSTQTGSSADRSLRLLALVAAAEHPLALADLAQHLALPKTTAHRLCMQLLDSGHLVRDVDERSYSAGPALRQLAFDTLNHGHTRSLRHEVLDELVREVGETCNFTTLDGARVLYLDRVEAPWPWRLTLDVGTHVPLHCTASGKLFLAYMPAAQREQLITELPKPKLTAHTLSTARALRSECLAIAQQGHALDREEFIAGLIALAVPVRSAQGGVRAAVAVHAPTARLSVTEALARLPALKHAAARLAALL